MKMGRAYIMNRNMLMNDPHPAIWKYRVKAVAIHKQMPNYMWILMTPSDGGSEFFSLKSLSLTRLIDEEKSTDKDVRFKLEYTLYHGEDDWNEAVVNARNLWEVWLPIIPMYIRYMTGKYILPDANLYLIEGGRFEIADNINIDMKPIHLDGNPVEGDRVFRINTTYYKPIEAFDQYPKYIVVYHNTWDDPYYYYLSNEDSDLEITKRFEGHRMILYINKYIGFIKDNELFSDIRIFDTIEEAQRAYIETHMHPATPYEYASNPMIMNLFYVEKSNQYIMSEIK